MPLALDGVFRRMVAKAPIDRYQTMAEVVLALEAVESGKVEKTGVTLIRNVHELEAGPSPPGENLKTSLGPTPSQSGEKRAEKILLRPVPAKPSGGGHDSGLWLRTLRVGSVSGSRRRGSGAVLQAFRETCEPVVNRFDGTIVRLSARGLLSCFGYPMAYEDAASRAAKAGISLLQETKVLDARLSSDHKLQSSPWVGIHTGQAVVEAQDGAVSLVGDALNIAVRLEDVVQIGQVVCSAATHRLIAGHFECVSLGLHKIKGAVQPVEIFHVQSVLKVGA